MKNRSKPFALAKLWGLEPLCATRDANAALTAAVWRVDDHRSRCFDTPPDPDTLIVVVYLEGSFRAISSIDGVQRFAGVRKPGQFIVVPPGRRWAVEMPQGLSASTVHIYLPTAVLRHCWDDGVMPPDAVDGIDGQRNAEINRLARLVVQETCSPGPASRVLLDSVALSLGVELRRHRRRESEAVAHATSGIPRWRLKRVHDLIMANLGKDLSLGELAAEAGYSVSRFCHAFKETTGLSPHRYVIQRRVECARDLVLEGRLTLVEIAAATGFSDQAHMTHSLRRYLFTTPKRLRHLAVDAAETEPMATSREDGRGRRSAIRIAR